MAKDKKAEEPRAISLEMIEGQVKKGKARKLFLIYKGATIKSLVVFKKGAFGPKILKAKKDRFKGEFAYGVVTGSRKNLFFQLPATSDVADAMKVDGFMENTPTKNAKLQKFLGDNGLKFKPSFHMITELGDAPAPESENDLEVPPPPPGREARQKKGELSSESQSEAANDAPPEAPPAPTEAALAITQSSNLSSQTWLRSSVETFR
ncbi:MAG: hypothetical protein VXZ82_06810 [Planctomycetota bacterium]|nr:hypothetical protein [Planctomycetota bacterium]